ncbi:MAG: SIMPL domain-containing protein, partial [Patescibacteria group bacterium]
ADLQQANTQKTNGAIAFVKEKGVEAKDIKTQSYNVEPRYQYFNCGPIYREGETNIYSSGLPCPPSEIVGYTVRTIVSIKVRNFEEVGAILSGVVQNGANSVSGLQFTVDDPTMVENEARAEAIAKAKEKAEALADAGEFRLGRLLSINESNGAVPYYDRLYAEGIGGGMPTAAPAPVIEAGSQEFQITMTLTYEIR